jgi:hypothetical protein
MKRFPWNNSFEQTLQQPIKNDLLTAFKTHFKFDVKTLNLFLINYELKKEILRSSYIIRRFFFEWWM